MNRNTLDTNIYVCYSDNSAVGCSLFLFEYDNLLRTPNSVGSNETDYDDVPDRNFKFVENLYTMFPQ